MTVCKQCSLGDTRYHHGSIINPFKSSAKIPGNNQMKAFLHKLAFPLYTPGYVEDCRGTCMRGSRCLLTGMPKFLPPQDILKGSVLESCVSVTNPTCVHSPEPAKPLEESWPVVLRTPSKYIIHLKSLEQWICQRNDFISFFCSPNSIQLQFLYSSKLPLADSQLFSPCLCSVGGSQWAAGFITNELLIHSLLTLPAGTSGQCCDPRLGRLGPGWALELFLAGRASLEQFVVLLAFHSCFVFRSGLLLCILQCSKWTVKKWHNFYCSAAVQTPPPWTLP